MGLCQHFQDPAEHCQCQQGVKFAALAGGGTHYMLLKLPCIPISNRRGEVVSHCAKYQPGEDHGQE